MSLDQKMQERLNNDFTYHPPHGDQADRYEDIRDAGRIMAMQVCDLAPESRERSLALTKIDEAVFWANAAIARNE